MGAARGIPSDIVIDGAAAPKAFVPFEPPLPRRFGPFELLRLLGHGGMARVYEAHRLGAMGLRAPVAVKLLHEHLSCDQRFLSLFVREAALTSELCHPNLLQLHEFNEVQGRYFIATELVDGCDLGRLIVHGGKGVGRLPPMLVVEVMSQLLRGLGWAHRARGRDGRPLELVHRDLKPANVLISQSGAVKVADFGVARSSVSGVGGHTAQDVIGTLTYMSPEHVGAQQVSQISDLFSAGLILFEMLVGEALVSTGPMRKVVGALMRFDLKTHLARVPADRAEFLPVLEAALQPDPSRRYGTAQEMEDDLHALRALLPAASGLARHLAPYWPALTAEGAYESGATNVDTALARRFTLRDLDLFNTPARGLRLLRS